MTSIAIPEPGTLFLIKPIPGPAGPTWEFIDVTTHEAAFKSDSTVFWSLPWLDERSYLMSILVYMPSRANTLGMLSIVTSTVQSQSFTFRNRLDPCMANMLPASWMQLLLTFDDGARLVWFRIPACRMHDGDET